MIQYNTSLRLTGAQGQGHASRFHQTGHADRMGRDYNWIEGPLQRNSRSAVESHMEMLRGIYGEPR